MRLLETGLKDNHAHLFFLIRPSHSVPPGKVTSHGQDINTYPIFHQHTSLPNSKNCKTYVVQTITPITQLRPSFSAIRGENLNIAALQTTLSYTIFANISQFTNQGLGNVATWTRKLHPVIQIANMMENPYSSHLSHMFHNTQPDHRVARQRGKG